jgi:Uri superfamily endonuclease
MSSRKGTSSSCTSDRPLPAGGGSGIYALVLWLPRAASVACGGLGVRRLRRGWYVYVGSAKRNLWARLRRHLAGEKRLHWHIDHLRLHAGIRQIWVWPWRAGRECRTARWLFRQAGAVVAWGGFGSSDCRCLTHLAWLPSRPTAPADARLSRDPAIRRRGFDPTGQGAYSSRGCPVTAVPKE